MAELKLYRQKPVIVSAIRWDGTSESTVAILKAFPKHVAYIPAREYGDPPVKVGAYLSITNTYTYKDGKKRTSTQLAVKGNFVVQGQDDVVFSATPEVFAENYEEYHD